MKNLVSFIILLAILVSGCTQDEMLRNGTSASGGRIFTTSFESDESRTYVEDGHLLRWTAGDQISLFDGNTLPLQYQFKGWTGDNAGTFYMVSKPEGNGSPLNHNYAVYPYAQDVKVSKEGVLTATLPSKQHYAMNSFGLGDNTMVAVTRNVDDLFLNFKNVGGFLKLQLYGDDVTVKSITLTGNNGEKIAGEATLAVGYDEVPMVSMADSAATSITLDCGEKGVKIGTTAEEATEFWMVVPPVVFEKGITIKVRDFTNGVFTKTTDKKLVIERNVVKPMAVVKAVMEQDRTSLAISEDEEELEGWAAGMFGGNGTYVMGKPHGENGYLMTIGNVQEEDAAIVFMDESSQVREIFIDNTIITFGENTNGSVDVSIIDKDGNETIEKIALSSINLQSRASDDHGQQVGSINLAFNLKDLYDVTKDIIEDGGFTKKTAFEYLGTKIETLNNLVRAAGGPDILGDFLGDFGPWIDRAEGLAQLRDLALMYKAGATGGLAGACLAIYAGLYTTYLDLYDEHIKAYFGNNQVFIKDITYKGNGLNIELAISGCEPWYDVECGVIVKTESFPAPRYSDGLATQTVVRNGEYIFNEGNVQTDKTYYCRPFLITKDRATLWVGYIGEKIGPLVRYGETEEYKPEDELREALIKLYESTNGDNWTNNDNWCSDKPVEEWYGVAKDANGKYGLALYNNNLTGTVEQEFPECVIGLNFGSNKLTSINVSGCAKLVKLYCDNNQLTSVNVSGCTALDGLTCDENQLTYLNVEGCTSMRILYVRDCQLSSLDVSNCSALWRLWCDRNQLTSLNVSGCTSLTDLHCNNNQLTSLDVSDCTLLEDFSCSGNRFALLDVSSCTLLKSLHCYDHQLASLKIKGSKSLKEIKCDGDQLMSLDVSGCTGLWNLSYDSNLTELNASNTALTGFGTYSDCQLQRVNLSGCVSLTGVSFRYSNSLVELDVSGCTSLMSLNIYDNQLTSLDVSNLVLLKELLCDNNQLTSLNVSGCTSLETIWCRRNQLTSLNVSGFTSLQVLSCDKNQLTSLDASGCTSLQGLSCDNNPLETVNISGCTELDDFSFNEKQLTSFNVTGCTSLKTLSVSATSVDVSNFKSLEYLAVSRSGSVNASNCTSMTQFGANEVASVNISGCTALSVFVHLNQVSSSLNASGCTSLKSLDCSYSQLTSLNVSGCTALESLRCHNNQLTSLNVSGCTALEELLCYKNQLTSLNVSSCTALEKLSCLNNQLTSLNLSGLTKLFEVNCRNNKICSVIPNSLRLYHFEYDIRYVYYWYRNEDGEEEFRYEDRGVGWWYPGEPGKGHHSPD